jgi:hypothetical protein
MAGNSGPNIVNDSLLLHLDAANSDSYVSGSSTWFDISGRGNHATLSGTYQYIQNNSILFNSGSQLNGTGRALLNLPSTTSNQFTIECVFRINRYRFLNSITSIAAQLFSSGRTGGNFDRSFYLGRNSVSGEVENAGLSYYVAGGGDGPGGNSNNFIFRNNIYHTIVTLVPSSLVSFYINGAFSVSRNASEGGFSLNGDWCIANQPTFSDEGVDANFYSVRVYTKALSASEILQNYNSQKSRFGLP